jgi:tRNA-dihydrouridine synthase A
MIAAVHLPISVKSRIGIDDHDDYDALARFVSTVAAAGCQVFIVHARRAVLGGLSPKQNRDVPPLRHEFVHCLKRDFPNLEIILNGGIRSLDEAGRQLAHVDGVMLGRVVCDNPWLLAEADRKIFGFTAREASRREVFGRFMRYAESRLAHGEPLHAVTRHALGIFQGQPGARAFRRHLSRHAVLPGAGLEVMRTALAHVSAAG